MVCAYGKRRSRTPRNRGRKGFPGQEVEDEEEEEEGGAAIPSEAEVWFAAEEEEEGATDKPAMVPITKR